MRVSKKLQNCDIIDEPLPPSGCPLNQIENKYYITHDISMDMEMFPAGGNVKGFS